MPDRFTPPDRLLLGPGPTNPDPSVLAASALPSIGHLDPAFGALMEEIKASLRRLLKSSARIVMPISAPASLAMEAAIINVLEPGDKAIIAQNGVFGGRMKDIVTRAGGEAVHLEFEWGKPVDPEVVERAIRANPDARLLGFVHAETSTGVRSDAAALCGLARKAGLLSLVDCVTSLGGIDVDMDGWGADIIYSGSQKCLGVPPGLAPIAFSEAALDAIQSRKTQVQSWFMDMNLVLGYWSGEGARSYHHTAPVNALYGLYEGLRLVLEEGLEARITRHKRAHELLAHGLGELGIEFLVDPAHRLPQLNSVLIPPGIDDASVRARLLEEYGIEIGAGLGALAGKIWRIGLMGPNADEEVLARLLEALKSVLAR